MEKVQQIYLTLNLTQTVYLNHLLHRIKEIKTKRQNQATNGQILIQLALKEPQKQRESSTHLVTNILLTIALELLSEIGIETLDVISAHAKDALELARYQEQTKQTEFQSKVKVSADFSLFSMCHQNLFCNLCINSCNMVLIFSYLKVWRFS